MTDTCIGDGYDDCCEPVKYIRHTQFAGSHPLCEKHARAEKDFMQDDSCTQWEVIEGNDEI